MVDAIVEQYECCIDDNQTWEPVPRHRWPVPVHMMHLGLTTAHEVVPLDGTLIQYRLKETA